MRFITLEQSKLMISLRRFIIIRSVSISLIILRLIDNAVLPRRSLRFRMLDFISLRFSHASYLLASMQRLARHFWQF